MRNTTTRERLQLGTWRPNLWVYFSESDVYPEAMMMSTYTPFAIFVNMKESTGTVFSSQMVTLTMNSHREFNCSELLWPICYRRPRLEYSYCSHTLQRNPSIRRPSR
jgi:hypothetical protein